jgi:hypothetical protein
VPTFFRVLKGSLLRSKIIEMYLGDNAKEGMCSPSRFALAFAISTLVTCQQAPAQVSSQPRTQEERNIGPRPALDRRWTLQRDEQEADPPLKSTKTRDQRKAETLAALKTGDRLRGQQSDPRIDRGQASVAVIRPSSSEASGLQRAER